MYIWKANSKMADVIPILSVITLNVNEWTHKLNSDIDRVYKKYDPNIYYLQQDHFKFKDTKDWRQTNEKDISCKQ